MCAIAQKSPSMKRIRKWSPRGAALAPITVSAKWQDPPGSMERILAKSVTVSGAPLIPGCMVAHFSTMVRITDNYVAFRVTVDGAPMNGHYPALAGVARPAVWVAISTQDEQLTDPIRTVSFNFFANVLPGNHLVEVWAAGGSNIVTPPGGPVIFNPVLTLEYR